MSVPPLLSLLAGLAVVLGTMALLVRVVRALRPDLVGRKADGPSLEVRSRASLAPRQGVAVVQYRDRELLVSYGDGGVRLLHRSGGEKKSDEVGKRPEYGDEEGPRVFSGREEQADLPARVGQAFSPGWWDRFRKTVMLGGAGLALLAGWGGLQSLRAQPLPQEGIPEAAQEVPAQRGDQVAEEASDPTDSPGLSPERAIFGLARQLPKMDLSIGEEDEEGLLLSGPVGIVLFMGFLTLLPTLLLLMTGFTRILVVMHLLKQALGTQTAPPTHLLTAMALLLTGFVMAPTLSEVNRTALDPWLEGEMDEVQMISTASGPFRNFMLSVTREEDLGTFLDMHGGERPTTVDEIPMVVVTSAFVTSELRHAFQIGFALFLPFVVIDIVVASILMSMGMFMLPPVMVSLPFKLLLFVLVDGWSLVVEGLVRSFG